MQTQRIFSAIVLAIALVFSNVSTALALIPPSSFWGTVTLDGGSVPAGTVVSARINGVQYASTPVTISLGIAYYSLIVPGDEPDTTGIIEGGVAGNTVDLYIGSYKAAQTGTWQSGPNVRLDLTAATNTAITVTGITANNKVYDGGTAATLNTSGYAFVGVASGDTVTLVTSGATAAFANKNVGTGKSVTVAGLSLGGADAYKYTLTQPTGLTANITAKPITITPTDGQSKVYGAADPVFAYTPSPALESGDSFSGALGRAGGTDVGTYAFTLNTLSAGSNYSLTLASGHTFAITKAGQTITFNALTDEVLGAPDFTVSATSDSGLAVSFSSTTTSVCTVSGSTVHLVATGTCTIRASQGGNSNYNAATPVDRSFTVNAPANIAPVITEGDSINVTMSASTPFSLTLNVTDANSDTITWSVSIVAGHGTASTSGTGTSKSIAYTPAPNYTGSDSFDVQVSDGNGGTDTITVNVNIAPVEPTSFKLFLPLILR